MQEFLQQLVEQIFVGPMWPASILVCLLVIYTLLAMIGLIDFGFEAPEVDLDPGLDLDAGLDIEPSLDVDPGMELDAAADASVDVSEVQGGDLLQGVGAAAVRWTNFGRVPVVIWGGAFAVSFWTISYILWHSFDRMQFEPTIVTSTLLSIRNMVIAVMATKAITQPLVKYFLPPPSYTQRTLMGATCEISTSEATPDFGQAKFRTNAAPLLLNVRTDGKHIPKGTEVRIIGFHDRDKRIYKVTQVTAGD